MSQPQGDSGRLAPVPAPADANPWDDVRAIARASRAGRARVAGGRLSRVNPATCDHEYSAEEMEFLLAVEAYKSRSGRKFPALSEVLGVLKSLGYGKPVAVETPFGMLRPDAERSPEDRLRPRP